MMDRFNLYNRFFDEAWPAELTPTEALVWLAMWGYANVKGRTWPGARKLADNLGQKSVSEIKRARSRLVKLGLLRVITPGGGSTPSTFEVCLPGGKIPPSGKDTPGGEIRDDRAGNSDDTGREIPPTPGGNFRTQTDHRTDQGTNQQKGEPPPFDLGLLRDDLRASHEFVSVLTDWLAVHPKSPAELKANLRNLDGMTVEQAIERANHSLAGGHSSIYKNLWSEKNGQSAKHRGRTENLKAPILNRAAN